MWQAVSRGVPSFGDLSWKRPVVAASDPSQSWTFPVPVLSPAGAAVPGQTMTAGANEAITSAPPFAGMTIVAGDRILATANHGLANSAGLWVVTTVGSGASKWVLTRATDGDTAAELVTGAMVQALAFLLSGTIYTDPALFARGSSGVWGIIPGLLAELVVIATLEVGDGSLQPVATIHGGIVLDSADWIEGGIDPDVQVFTANGTWNLPTGVHHIIVECVGGGGAGGSCQSTTASESSAAGSGGGGGYARKLLTAADLAGDTTYTVVRGAGGSPGAAGNNDGGDGAASSFAGTGITTVQGNGGTGGNGATATTGPERNVGGDGGTATGGDINVTGDDGDMGTVVRGDGGQGDPVPGKGGVAGGGMGGGGRASAASGNGTAGNQYGGGGAGGWNANSQGSGRTGGAGANGVVIVTAYFGP